MRIMAFGAHPDDVEILAAGTLLKHRDAGDEVAICVMTDGRLGGISTDLEAVAAMRHQEAQEAASMMDSTLYWLGVHDGFLFDDRRTRMQAVQAMRSFEPDLVITHHPKDYHPDHCATSTVVQACRQLVCEEALLTLGPALSTPPDLWFMDPLGLVGGSAEHWVDITETIERKHNILRCHHSQHEEVQCSSAAMGYFDIVERQALLRGLQSGVQYAEGFSRARVYPVVASTGL